MEESGTNECEPGALAPGCTKNTQRRVKLATAWREKGRAEAPSTRVSHTAFTGDGGSAKRVTAPAQGEDTPWPSSRLLPEGVRQLSVFASLLVVVVPSVRLPELMCPRPNFTPMTQQLALFPYFTFHYPSTAPARPRCPPACHPPRLDTSATVRGLNAVTDRPFQHHVLPLTLQYQPLIL